jgi:hypothetical protein
MPEANATAGMAIVILLVAMGIDWLCRVLLLNHLREKFPQEYAALGQPSTRQLESLLPRYQDLHLKFWKYLWGGRAFVLKDKFISSLAMIALCADVVMIACVAVFLWSAWQMGLG